MLPGAPALFVRAKEAGLLTSVADAVTVYGPPAVALAVKVGEVATPEALVCTVALIPPPANVPLAPEVGELNVTLAPETGLLFASITVATNGFPKACLTCAVWPPPEVAVMLPGGPGVFVKAKVVERPFTDEVTL
jgi:hypothetical protein